MPVKEHPFVISPDLGTLVIFSRLDDVNLDNYLL